MTVLVAIPSIGAIAPEFLVSYMEMARPLGSGQAFATRQVVSFARNRMAEGFLAGRHSHLFFLDDDVIVRHDTLLRLLSHDAPIVSGLYVNRRPPHHPVVFRQIGPDGTPNRYETVYDFGDDLMEVDAVGAGCLLIRRDVLEAIPAPWFQFVCYPEPGATYGEDVYACELFRRHGHKIMLDPSAQCGHLGLKAFTLADTHPRAGAASGLRPLTI